MIQDVLQAQLGQMLKVPSVAPIITVDAPLELSEWQVGQKLSAVVLANLPNGRFQVQVGEQTLEMNLPKNTQPGDNLQLAFADASPRLTFLLEGQTRAVAAAPPHPSEEEAAAPPVEQKLPPAILSDAARLVTALQAGRIAAAAGQGQTAATVGQHAPPASQGDPLPAQAHAAPLASLAAPVMTHPTADPQAVAGALKQAISDSGLFYEAHQAQWVMGERTLEQISREPQANLPAAAPRELPATLATLSQPVPQNVAGMPGNEALSYLQAQLDMLDTGIVSWQGQAWPEQEMHWKIARYPEAETSDDRYWQTSLELDLPRLGPIQAYLLLGEQGLQIRCRVEDAHTQELLHDARATLAAALQGAGLTVQNLTVQAHEKT